MLNVELAQLKERFLINYVAPESLTVFSDFLTRVFALGTIETCEIQLKAKGRAAAITALIEALHLCILRLTQPNH